MTVNCLKIDLDDWLHHDRTISIGEIMLFEERIRDEEKRNFLAILLFNFVAVVAKLSKREMSFLLESIVRPLDKFCPDF